VQRQNHLTKLSHRSRKGHKQQFLAKRSIRRYGDLQIPQSYDRKEYFVSFTDDHNRWTYLETMANRSDTFTCYKQYEAWLETQHGAKLKCLQTDHHGEYLSAEFTSYLKTKGMV